MRSSLLRACVVAVLLLLAWAPAPSLAQRGIGARSATSARARTRPLQGGLRALPPTGYLQRGPQTGPGGSRGRPSSWSARPPVLPIRAIEQRLRAATVRIQVPWADGTPIAAGFVATDDGLVVTAAHVVSRNSGAAPVMLSLGDGPLVRANVVAYLPAHDVAVLRPEQPLGGRAVELGNDRAVDVGDALVVYGHPNGEAESVTRGIVNAHARRTSVLGDPNSVDRISYRDAIQSDAVVANGNSGGPVATQDGRVVGLVSAGSTGTTMIVPSRHIRAALRLAERAGGRTVGPWPVYRTSQRFSAWTDRENVWEARPAHPGDTSRVVVRTETDRTHFAETRPDGRRLTSTLTSASYARTHEVAQPSDEAPATEPAAAP